MTKTNEASLDPLDHKILFELQENGRLPFAELGRRVALSTPAVIERVRRLEDRGVIRGYRAEVDLEKMGYSIVAFLRIAVSGDALRRLPAVCQAVPQVLECYRITGVDSFLMKIVAGSVEELQSIIDRFAPYVHTNTSLVLSAHVVRRVINPREASVGLKAVRKQLMGLLAAHRPGSGTKPAAKEKTAAAS